MLAQKHSPSQDTRQQPIVQSCKGLDRNGKNTISIKYICQGSGWKAKRLMGKYSPCLSPPSSVGADWFRQPNGTRSHRRCEKRKLRTWGSYCLLVFTGTLRILDFQTASCILLHSTSICLLPCSPNLPFPAFDYFNNPLVFHRPWDIKGWHLGGKGGEEETQIK